MSDTALRRHRLVRLTAAGWRQATVQHTDPDAQRCLAHWAAHDLPLVVATQGAAVEGGLVSLGLPAPTRWGRARFALRIRCGDLRAGSGEFPLWVECRDALPFRPPRAPSALAELARDLPDTRVHGSFGWQHLTRLDYVHDGSDLDLLLPAGDARQADDIADLLMRCDVDRPRLDGELCFADGSAVAWREWAAWRAGRVRSILVKRLRGASVEADPGWLRDATAVPA